MKYLNDLRIERSGKGIPYGGMGEPREDGEANYGFKDLKGNLDQISSVPELARDPDLLALVQRINAPTVGLFSVGCTSGPVLDEQGHRVSGYVEFAINSVSKIQDASTYFPMFFHFDNALQKVCFDEKMHFGWVIDTAHFIKPNLGGFSAAIILNTAYHLNSDDAKTTWAASLDFLGQFLSAIPADSDPLYRYDTSNKGA